MDFLVVLLPLLPILSAMFIGVSFMFNGQASDEREKKTAFIARGAITVMSLFALMLLAGDLFGLNSDHYVVGEWLINKNLVVELSFITSGFTVVVAALFAIVLAIVTRFSTIYLHKEPGFVRYLFIFSLFSCGMMLIALSGNIVLTFIGWEMAGLCSYFLIAFAYNRSVAVINATRAFVTNRVGDAGFILGIALTFVYLGTTSWLELNSNAGELSVTLATEIALCFAIAAFAKSAQLPFSSWLARAMEGPTPSSAVFYGSVMIHSGVFLIILLQPLFEQAPLVMMLLVAVGLMTALYSFIVGLTQTDVKSSISFAITGQIGLMFVECGLGWWELASVHLCAHVVVRGYQVLSSPSLVFNGNGNPMLPVSPMVRHMRWLYNSSLQRFWLDPIIDRTLINPTLDLGKDLDYFDTTVVDRIMGLPSSSVRAASSLVQLENKTRAEESPLAIDEFVRSNGVAGKIFEWAANIMGWFEERLVLKGIGIDMVDMGRQLGHAANNFEKMLLKPIYPTLFGIIVLLIAASL